MSIALWREEYETGDSQIDQQHQHLFELINTLYHAIMAGTAKEILKQTLDELIQYTITHFQTEETLMSFYQYPDYQNHKNIHEELKRKVLDIAHRFKEDSNKLPVEISHVLTLWIIHHIRGEDQQMIKFLKSKLKTGSAK